MKREIVWLEILCIPTRLLLLQKFPVSESEERSNMAYTLESLIQILEQVLSSDHDKIWILDKKPDIESLLEKVNLLKGLLQNSSSSSPNNKRMEDLEGQLRDVVYKIEDILEILTVNQILPKYSDQSDLSLVNDRFRLSYEDLHEVVKEFDFIKEEMMKIMQDLQPSSALPMVSSRPEPSAKNIVVGLDEDIMQLKERLIGQRSKLQIIPIAGMGGSGKTTLARNLYNDSLVVYRFDIRAWVTISQRYNMRAVVLGLLECKKELGNGDGTREKSDYELVEQLYKTLKSRRYLIVMDDMWDTKVWDDLRRYFPDDNNGSCIMLTTRDLNVAQYVDSLAPHHQMRFLGEDESWDLLRVKVFPREHCSQELEKIGKKIARNCGGLPLALSVIGGVLSTIERSQSSWEQVLHNTMCFVTGDDDHEHVPEILSLSYYHLPHHMKPCFLYMGAFPEDKEIRASKLIKLWVAEGFLKPINDKSLEETGEVYLEALVNRNLILINQQESNLKVKACSIHDLLRDLCLRKAREEKFLYVKRFPTDIIPKGGISIRRVSPHPSSSQNNIHDSMESILFARSWLCTDAESPFFDCFWNLRLLRVLDIPYITFKHFPTTILQLVNLRYLAFSCFSNLPSSISRFWNLQTLIFYKPFNNMTFNLPFEIWEMTRLRHIKFQNISLFYPLKYRNNFVPHQNLQSLSTVTIFKESMEILQKFPNLKKLEIFCDASELSPKDLSPLENLETLKCNSNSSVVTDSFLSHLILPHSLRKLTLIRCAIPWMFMATIGSLPNLEMLKIRSSNFEGSEWEPVEGEFCRLQFLQLEKVNLVQWRADETNFPNLRHLVIRCCFSLEEIPCGVGDIPAIEMIEVDESSPSVVESAKQIQEEQQDNGNTLLQVRIHGGSRLPIKRPKHFYGAFDNKLGNEEE
ncbi:hypothetical protein BUALT_Bualt07G0046300 [Buddleja alternifolia]|uniref:Late blight resistance protein homolog R1A-3 n=1 Tax=Buddleja alternifolia TaxID=168488 RepID=A0AAV6XIZ8_9LAMI|nr:hypothetical protein BUALT_Bualt07G0046300 [Buddleja alternifolia]